MWINHRFFKYLTGIILILICIFFLELLHFFEPLLKVFNTLFYPFLIAGFLFYLIRPLIGALSKIKFFPKPVAILLVFAGIAGVIYAGVNLLADTVKEQITNISNLPQKLKDTAKEAEKQIEEKDMGMLSTDALSQRVNSFFSDFIQTISDNASQILSGIAGATTVLIIVPVVLFFLLKDGHKLIPFLRKAFPRRFKVEVENLLKDVDKTLSAYLIGQVTVAFVDGVLAYIGFLIIGLDYALVLSMFIVVTAIIPFFGPIIGTIPAFVVALMQDPAMALYVVIIIIVVQQLEGNLVAPLVLGNRLHLHPLTIILLIIVAAPLFGFIGMVIIVPLYAVVKMVLKDLYKMYQAHT
ncbi:AI-2E family transporter [Halobacillus mangrovi]|uniref:AI-2E family transporter n=1 Tax=Halobacillus mangrovi TaxID=402384 RepID=UPI003D9587C9